VQFQVDAAQDRRTVAQLVPDAAQIERGRLLAAALPAENPPGALTPASRAV